ncbi:VWA domain-containing protein [Vibrio sp. ZSDE26]|uniref:VWA domain-containing protein n=1 Tax=Vibrio amylolyticus TaxID=2847292 RepID=A0A9X1XJF9_9VIBR|nr:VWA domain-containing protein [Vibrio amylolyticus]MCK6262783.1 VWA domain-containing protein [Vibrio amylolyticus]
MSEFHFIRPAWLLALIVVGLIAWLIRQLNSKNDVRDLIAPHLQASVLTKDTTQSRLSPKALLPWALAALVIICAGPTWKPEPGTQAQNQSPLILVVDLSCSMAESDVTPTRLEAAKLKITELINSREEGEIGIWVYAGSAHLLLPPTQDRNVLDYYLDSLSTSLVPRAGKNVSAVLNGIKESNLQAEGFVFPGSVILITDQIDRSSQQAMTQYLQDSDDQLLVWKFGYSASLDAPSGVQTISMSADELDLKRINRWVDDYQYFDPQDSDIEWQEAGYFLVFALLLITLTWFRRGWTIRWFALPWLFIMSSTSPNLAYADEVESKLSCQSLWMEIVFTPEQQARWHFERENYACAAQLFTEPEWKVEALMRDSQWEWALMLLNNLEVTEPSDQVRRGLNIGIAYTHLQRFRSAERWFNSVLEIEQANPVALHNLEIIEDIFKLMEERALGQGTAGEDMTADFVNSLAEDMGIEEPEDKIEVINSADLIAEEHLNKIWLEQVQTSPEVFLRNKFSNQLNSALSFNEEISATEAERKHD